MKIFLPPTLAQIASESISEDLKAKSFLGGHVSRPALSRTIQLPPQTSLCCVLPPLSKRNSVTLYKISAASAHNIGQSRWQRTLHLPRSPLELSSELRANLLSPIFRLLAHSYSVLIRTFCYFLLFALVSYVVYTIQLEIVNIISSAYEVLWLHYIKESCKLC